MASSSEGVPRRSPGGDGDCHLEIFQDGAAFVLLPRGGDEGVIHPPEPGGLDSVSLREPGLHEEVGDRDDPPRLHDLRARVHGGVGPQLVDGGIGREGVDDGSRRGHGHRVLKEVEDPPPHLHDVPLVAHQLPLDREEHVGAGAAPGYDRGGNEEALAPRDRHGVLQGGRVRIGGAVRDVVHKRPQQTAGIAPEGSRFASAKSVTNNAGVGAGTGNGGGGGCAGPPRLPEVAEQRPSSRAVLS